MGCWRIVSSMGKFGRMGLENKNWHCAKLRRHHFSGFHRALPQPSTNYSSWPRWTNFFLAHQKARTYFLETEQLVQAGNCRQLLTPLPLTQYLMPPSHLSTHYTHNLFESFFCEFAQSVSSRVAYLCDKRLELEKQCGKEKLLCINRSTTSSRPHRRQLFHFHNINNSRPSFKGH